MTNAEKFEEVFGFTPHKTSCLSDTCAKCPAHCANLSKYSEIEAMLPISVGQWWDSEYKEK